VLKELGIGTNDPASAVHIVKETAGAGFLTERIQASVNSGSFAGRKSRGTLDARAVVVANDSLLTVSGFAYVGDNNTYQETCRIDYDVDGSVSDAAKGAPGRIIFRTSSGSGLLKRMRITSAGKVGIGLDDPSTKLTVEGTITLKEQAAADADVAAYGQLWVKTATPNELYFTTDAGNDIQITSGTAMAGGSGDITSVVAGAGMTGGATSGAATLNVIGGDGITANADEIEATVDGSTIELSASDGSGTIRVKDNGVTLAKMAGLTRGSIIYGDASGDPAALAVGSANTVLQSDGTDSSWGTVATAMIADNAVSLAKMAGLARGKIIYGDASGDPAALAVGDADQVLTTDGTDISWEDASGGGVSLSGSTNNTVATVTGSNALIGEANLTFDGNSLAVVTGSASAIPCTITGASGQSVDLFVVEANGGGDYFSVNNAGTVVMGLAGSKSITTKEQSGTNTAGHDIFIKAGKSTGNGEGGDVRIYTSPVGSSGSSVNAWAEALKVRHDKIVDFKIAAHEDGAGSLAEAEGASLGKLFLEIKVGGTQYYVPLYV
tara:strand:- start:3222 stop:4877 length:1656 start_codon:yes stop_codon:yes gene_type:complete